MEKKIYPNETCPCGSGKKYKKCCALKPLGVSAFENIEIILGTNDFRLSLTKEEANCLLYAIDVDPTPIKTTKCLMMSSSYIVNFLKIGICDILDKRSLPLSPYKTIIDKGIENGQIISTYKSNDMIYYQTEGKNKSGMILSAIEDICDIDEDEQDKMKEAMSFHVTQQEYAIKCNQEQSQVKHIKECLNKDISYLKFLICEILENGERLKKYSICSSARSEYSQIMKEIDEFILRDKAGILYKWNLFNEKYDYTNTVLAPYDPVVQSMENNTDVYCEYKKGNVTIFQIALFHEYIVRYLIERFDAYRFLPSNILRNDNCVTTVYHKGFDSLVAIAINLELQLGIQLVFQDAFCNNAETPIVRDSWFKKVSADFSKNDFNKLSIGNKFIISSYFVAIDTIIEKYNPYIEFNVVYESNKMYDTEMKSVAEIVYMNLPQGNGFFLDYKNSLRAMCFGMLCGNPYKREKLFSRALQLCTQMDYLKMIEGIEKAEKLFNAKQNASWSREEYIHRYHEAVFYFFDEKNGVNHGNYPPDLAYVDDDTYDALSRENGYYRKNPSFRERYYYDYKHLRIEVFEMLGGTFFTWYEKDKTLKGVYPLIPFYAENAIRIHRDEAEKAIGWTSIEELFSNNNDKENIEERQGYLGLEREIDEIPVACFREYMTAPVFYSWLKQKEFLKTIQQQNEQLTQTNIDLNRHINLNMELVRSLSHSSANYLNSNKLAQTGTELHTADYGNPTIEKLHYDGLLLLLQSEHETFLRRRLDSLVIRCSANGTELKRSIREGVSKSEGISLMLAIEYAVRTVVSRFVTRDDDIRSEAIRNKFNKTQENWGELRESFIRSVLAEGVSSLQWCNEELCSLKYILSDTWKKLRIWEERSFFDLIVEILTEQLLNAFSHGDVDKEISIILGESDVIKRKGRIIPTWFYVQTTNVPGENYKGGRHAGIETLNATLMLLNDRKRGIDVCDDNGIYCMTAWLEADLFRPL